MAVITMIVLLHRQKVAYNTEVNTVYVLLIPYVVSRLTAAYQGTTKDKTDKNIIYKYLSARNKLYKNLNLTVIHIKEGIISNLMF